MPAEAKPLFRPEAVRPKLLHFFVPPEIQQRPVKLLGSKQAEKLIKTRLLSNVVADAEISPVALF